MKYLVERFSFDEAGALPIKVDADRFRGLTSMFKDLGFKKGVEVGVNNGRYSKWIMIKAKPDKLYLVDPYKEYASYVESHYNGQDVFDQYYENAKTRLKQWTDQARTEFIRKESMSAVEDFVDNSLDFVFIDGNHTFEYVVNDIAEWEKKIKPGGIISGHDYWRSFDSRKPLYVKTLTPKDKLKLIQVKDAVDGWTRANQIKPWFVTKDRCWFYVKQ